MFLLWRERGPQLLISQEQMERLFKDEEVIHYEPIRGWEHTQFGLRCGFKLDKPYAMQLAPGRRATCRARITHLKHGDSHWRMTLRIDRTVQDTPRFLQASGGKPRGQDLNKGQPGPPVWDDMAKGYTHMPAKALRDAGEAIDDETLGRYTKEGWERHEARLEEQMNQLPPMEQLAFVLKLAEEEGVDPEHVHSAMRRRSKALLRQIEQQRMRRRAAA